MDSSGGDIPESMNGRSIVATDSCIAISCLCEMDGETEIVLCEAGDISPGKAPAFEAVIRTPSHEVTVMSVLIEPILVAPVSTERTNVRLWVNDAQEPDHVIICVQ